MADRTYLFEELLTEPNLRGKVYEVSDSPDGQLACVDLTARRGVDWFFARRWVSVRVGRRWLFRVVDECERWGFRFAVASTSDPDAPLSELRQRSQRASEFVEALDPDEQEIYRELFPQETMLLSQGYDWNHRTVWHHDQLLAKDAHGRILERDDHVLWEWVRVDEEFTWRRYPLERSPRPVDSRPPLAAEAGMA